SSGAAWKVLKAAALLLICAGDRPDRKRSEVAWTHMCATAPSPSHQARPPAATASTLAVTAKPTTPCGGS
ncbi:MAG: hypothetical protein M3083_06150, partial [Actinomycetota bacterium]|nr:hypothetical protein [Actinomycetota bacterium]